MQLLSTEAIVGFFQIFFLAEFWLYQLPRGLTRVEPNPLENIL